MPVALRRITPAVVQSIQVFFQVVLYAGLFIFAQYLVSWLHLPLPANLVGAIALLAINFDLVMATALINFGALVAFTFVNLSVISQFWIREKRNKTLKDHFQYLFMPMCGALTVGALWVNLEESSMVLGLIWAAIGLIYLACVTKSFRNPVPQYEDVA